MSDVDALLIERAGYLRRGLNDRVASVDAEIKRLGGVLVSDEPIVDSPPDVPKSARRQTTR